MGMLKGKVAIITGASSGIGESAAKLFTSEGARVILGGRRKEKLDNTVDDIKASGGSAIAIAGDVSREDYAMELVNTALEAFGRLDVGFNNAGIIGEMTELTATTAESWNKTINTNLTGAFFGAKHQISAMTPGGSGSIIFTSSFVGHTVGFANTAPYAASKAGIIGMTKCLAVELGQQGVRVNALLPGGTKTAMLGDFSDDPSAEKEVADFHALKRLAEPLEIAKAALFLASDNASFVTGSAMIVDGGNSVTKA